MQHLWLSLRVLSQVRKTYTGKLAGLQDDVVIALQLALIASKVFFESPRYQGTNSSLEPFLSLQTPAFPAHPCTFFPSLCVLSRLARLRTFVGNVPLLRAGFSTQPVRHEEGCWLMTKPLERRTDSFR